LADKGYRAQQPEPETTPAPQSKGGGGATIAVGAVAIAVTVGAIVLLVHFMGQASEERDTAGPASAMGGPMGPGGPEMGDIGPDSAPVRVLAMPGSCADHITITGRLKELAEEYEGTLQVRVRQIGDPEAQSEGMSCAGYALRVDGKDPGFGGTPGGYIVLGEQMPGGDYTVATIEESVLDAIASVESSGDALAEEEQDSSSEDPEPITPDADGTPS